MIKQAIDILKNGGLVGIPTETVYGLAADITQNNALKKIFELKERPFFDPLIIHVRDKNQVKNYTDNWCELADFLADSFWPGPLTIVAPKNNKVDELITAGHSSVGLRCPNHPLTLELLQHYPHPLAAPSANKFKQTSPTKVEHVKKYFPDLFVLDGGESIVGIESTVVEIENDHIYIYRPGMISKKMLENKLKEFPMRIRVEEKPSPVAPGQLEEHYQPQKPFYLVKEKIMNGAELVLDSNPAIAARELYDKLHFLSEGSHTSIYLIEDKKYFTADWNAIWNRISKALTKTNQS